MNWQLEARRLARRAASGVHLLDGASLTVSPGDRLGISGESGAGKTVLLRALAALDPLDGGALYWCGAKVAAHEYPRYRARAAYVHQRPVIFEGTVEDNLALPYSLSIEVRREPDDHRAHRFDWDRACALLERFGKPASFLEKHHADLSGGEAQVVALVRTLLIEPAVLLLDEPTASLDGKSAAIVVAALAAWVAEANAARAIVCVSHDLELLAELTTRRILVQRGRLTDSP